MAYFSISIPAKKKKKRLHGPFLCCPTRGRVYRSIFKEIQREDVQGRRID
jgi:hypothetical protein